MRDVTHCKEIMRLEPNNALGWRRRRLKRTSAESWEMFRAACTTSIRKTPEAEWITVLRASVAGDSGKPGLKPYAAENRAQVRSHVSHCDVFGGTETTAPRSADADNIPPAQSFFCGPDAAELRKGRSAGSQIKRLYGCTANRAIRRSLSCGTG